MGIGLEKSRKFAIRIYNLYKYLCEEKHEYILSKQLLRSGTSISVKLSKAQYAVNRKEFLVKTKIALKKCAETEYWLDILKETSLINQNEYNSIIGDNKEILRLLIVSVRTITRKSEQLYG